MSFSLPTNLVTDHVSFMRSQRATLVIVSSLRVPNNSPNLYSFIGSCHGPYVIRKVFTVTPVSEGPYARTPVRTRVHEIRRRETRERENCKRKEKKFLEGKKETNDGRILESSLLIGILVH